MTFQMISRHETCKCVHVLFKRVQPFLYCSKPLWGYCWGSSLHPIIFWGWGRFALCTYPCSFFTLIRSHIHHPNFLINMARPKRHVVSWWFSWFRSWIALLLGTSNIFQHCVWNLSELYLGIFGPLPETAWAKAASQASNFQDSTLTFARLGASQSIAVGLDVGQVASLPSSSVSSERSSEVSLGCCIFPIRIAVVDGHPMVPSGNQTVTLLDGKISCTDDFRINLPFIGDFPLRCSMAGGHPMFRHDNVSTVELDMRMYISLKISKNISVPITMIHMVSEICMRNGNTRPTNLELKIWEWYEIVLKSDKKHRKHAKRVNPPWAFCLVTCTFENRISNCRWFQCTNDPSWSMSFIRISWCVQPTEANQSPETLSCSLAILRNNVTPMGAVLKNITGRKSGPVAFT